jgi:predicted Zn-dependent protease with MMP-like domain
MIGLPRDTVETPRLDDFVEMADLAWKSLPAQFRDRCGNLDIHIKDFASEETLDALDINNKYRLSGVYIGVDLTRQSIGNPPTTPARVVLFRRPLLEEWKERGNVTLYELVNHVLVHEIGHHFGLSDDDMHALERES